MNPRGGALWCCLAALAGATPPRAGHLQRYYNYSSKATWTGGTLDEVASFMGIGSAERSSPSDDSSHHIFEKRYVGNRMMQEQLHGVEENSVRAMIVSQDARKLYTTGGVDGKVYIWNIAYITWGEYGPTTTTTTTTTTWQPNAHTLRQELARIKRVGVPGSTFPGGAKRPERQDKLNSAHPERTTPQPPPLSIPLVAAIDAGMRVNSMALSSQNILFLGGDNGGIMGFNLSQGLHNLTAADAVMRIVSGTVVKKLSLTPPQFPNDLLLCGVGSYGPPATETDKESQDANELGPEASSKVDALTSELPGGDHASAAQGLSAAGALAEQRSKSSEYVPNGWLRCWDIAGLKKGVVPDRIVDVRRANILKTIMIPHPLVGLDGPLSSVIYVGGDDNLVREFTFLPNSREPDGSDGSKWNLASVGSNVNETNQFLTLSPINVITYNPIAKRDYSRDQFIPNQLFVGTQGGRLFLYLSRVRWAENDYKPQTPLLTAERGGSIDAVIFDRSSLLIGVAGWGGDFEPPVEPPVDDGKPDDNDKPPPGDNPGRITFFDVDTKQGRFQAQYNIYKNDLSWVNCMLLGPNVLGDTDIIGTDPTGKAGPTDEKGDPRQWLFTGGNDGSVQIFNPGNLKGSELGQATPEDVPQATLKNMVWVDNRPQGDEPNDDADPNPPPVNKDDAKKAAEAKAQTAEEANADIEPSPNQAAPAAPATSFLERIKRAVRAAATEAASWRSRGSPLINSRPRA